MALKRIALFLVQNLTPVIQPSSHNNESISSCILHEISSTVINECSSSLVLTFIVLGLVFKFYCTVYDKVLYGFKKTQNYKTLKFVKTKTQIMQLVLNMW
jgi:hypothetical protein